MRMGAGIDLRPHEGARRRFDLRPGATIGTVVDGDLRIDIRPKLPIQRVLFLMGYTADRVRWRPPPVGYAEDEQLVEAIAAIFVRLTTQAIARGLLQGYREEEDALSVIRGRIRFDEQIRARFGQAPPVELRFDVFTPDIELNRLLKAAVHALGRMPLRSERTRSALRSLAAAFAPVRLVEYRPRRLPAPRFDRLNEHYAPAVALARSILAGVSLRHARGQAQGISFLVNMNDLFEDFVATALREALGLPPRAFPRAGEGPALHLDEGRRVRLKPDLSWWEGGRCVFIGDVKYKRATGTVYAKHPDLYQLLAYTEATGLGAGMLVYAAGEDEERRHVVASSGTVLEVVTLELDGTPAEVLASIDEVAARVRGMRWSARERDAVGVACR